MLREGTLNDISDGRVYSLNDMVKADTVGCNGCFKCCQVVGDTIVLNPFDIYNIKKVTGLSFQELLNNKKIELNICDGLILPNLYLEEGKGCAFLADGRCSIHGNRPDICRLFPLGRIYLEDGFGYFVQKDQCVKKDLAKIKVKKWIGIDNMAKNQEFIGAWHKLFKMAGEKIISLKKAGMGEKVKDITMFVLNEFYVKDITEQDENSVYDSLIGKINIAVDLIDKV